MIDTMSQPKADKLAPRTEAESSLYEVVLSGERMLSQDDLFEHSRRVASGLAALGIGENDSVAVILRNDFAFLEVSFAAELLGAYMVPVNWHFVADEARYILDDCKARAVVIHADLLDQLQPAFSDEMYVIVVPTPPEIAQAYRLSSDECAVPEGMQCFPDWRDEYQPWPGQASGSRSSIIYTSGTTGRPKGVVREPAVGSMAKRVRDVVEYGYGIGEKDVIRAVVTGPMYHSVPNVYAKHAARTPGSLVILQPRFNAESLLALIERYQITHLHLVPTMMVRLRDLPDAVKDRYDISSLKRVAHGAAPCPVDVKQDLIDWFGPVISEYYGASETGPGIVLKAEDASKKPASVGRPNPWATVRILDDDGVECPPNEAGLIYMRIENYPRFEYLNRPEEKSGMVRGELLTVGDIGYFDEDGFIYVCDRAKDMVVSGGVNIYPAEIEAVSMEINGVRDCAVFGVPDSEFGERVVAVIERETGNDLSEDDVKNALTGRIAKYKIPRRIFFQENLPREDSGKLVKSRLKERYAEILEKEK